MLLKIWGSPQTFYRGLMSFPVFVGLLLSGTRPACPTVIEYSPLISTKTGVVLIRSASTCYPHCSLSPTVWLLQQALLPKLGLRWMQTLCLDFPAVFSGANLCGWANFPSYYHTWPQLAPPACKACAAKTPACQFPSLSKHLSSWNTLLIMSNTNHRNPGERELMGAGTPPASPAVDVIWLHSFIHILKIFIGQSPHARH